MKKVTSGIFVLSLSLFAINPTVLANTKSSPEDLLKPKQEQNVSAKVDNVKVELKLKDKLLPRTLKNGDDKDDRKKPAPGDDIDDDEDPNPGNGDDDIDDGEKPLPGDGKDPGDGDDGDNGNNNPGNGDDDDDIDDGEEPIPGDGNDPGDGDDGDNGGDNPGNGDDDDDIDDGEEPIPGDGNGPGDGNDGNNGGDNPGNGDGEKPTPGDDKDGNNGGTNPKPDKPDNQPDKGAKKIVVTEPTKTSNTAKTQEQPQTSPTTTENGGKLPNTATPLPLIGLIGAGLTALGAILARKAK